MVVKGVKGVKGLLKEVLVDMDKDLLKGLLNVAAGWARLFEYGIEPEIEPEIEPGPEPSESRFGAFSWSG